MTAAADGEIIDGSARLETGATVFGDDVLVVEHDGTKPIIMVRTDIESGDSPQAREIAYAANRIAQIDLDFDAEVILADLQAGVDLSALWFQDELDELLDSLGAGLGGVPDEPYSREIKSPVYKPTNDKPTIGELFDDTRTKELIKGIQAAPNLTDEERAFLTIAAQRHTVLKFNRIADFYAHADEPTQALMEDSALVIIDFNRAIELGYVNLAESIAEQYGADYGDA